MWDGMGTTRRSISRRHSRVFWDRRNWQDLARGIRSAGPSPAFGGHSGGRDGCGPGNGGDAGRRLRRAGSGTGWWIFGPAERPDCTGDLFGQLFFLGSTAAPALLFGLLCHWNAAALSLPLRSGIGDGARLWDPVLPTWMAGVGMVLRIAAQSADQHRCSAAGLPAIHRSVLKVLDLYREKGGAMARITPSPVYSRFVFFLLLLLLSAGVDCGLFALFGRFLAL